MNTYILDLVAVGLTIALLVTVPVLIIHYNRQAKKEKEEQK